MDLLMRSIIFITLFISATLSSTAFADNVFFSTEFQYGLANHDISDGSYSDSDNTTLYGIRTAYHEDEHISFELAYQDLGSISFSNNGKESTYDTSVVTASFASKVPLFYDDLSPYIDLTRLSLVGRIGISDIIIASTSSAPSLRRDNVAWYLGFELQYDVTEYLYYGFEYSRIDSQDHDKEYLANNFSLVIGLQFN